MRTVFVAGKRYNLPDDQDYIVQERELDHRTRSVINSRLTFPPVGDNRVKLEVSIEKELYAYEAEPLALPEPPVWERKPDIHIEKFLGPGQRGSLPSAGSNWATELGVQTIKDNYDSAFLDRMLEEPPKNTAKPQKGYFSEYKTSYDYDKTKTGRYPSGKKKSRAKNAPYKKYDKNPCNEMHYTERLLEEKHMPTGASFPTGTRVCFLTDTKKGVSRMGTVVGKVPEMKGKYRPSQILVCTDDESHYNSHHTEYTGIGHGRIVDAKKSSMTVAEDDSWYKVPMGVGVFVPEPFDQDGVDFHPGATGRIVSLKPGENMAEVSWNFSADNFHRRGQETADGRMWSNCWSVPISRLQMCKLDGKNKEMAIPWLRGFENKRPKKKIGDICRVRRRSVTALDKRDREVILNEDTVVELKKNNGDRHKTWLCEVIGGHDEHMTGVDVNINFQYLLPHPNADSFYRPGQKVEITAVVDFRKTPLQGMKGVVILSTDADGDVGIEFPNDIGAGSLDGVGKEGHCIYLEADAVKSSE